MADSMNQERSVMIIAADVIRDIVEGRDDIVYDIASRLETTDVVLVNSTINAGLKKADDFTIDGFDGLAKITELWGFGIVPRALDIDVAGALLSAREGDAIYTNTFAEFIDVVFIHRVPLSVEKRTGVYMPEKDIDELRAKLHTSEA